jgi:hypothetical protein
MCGPKTVRPRFGHRCGLPWGQGSKCGSIKPSTAGVGVIDDTGGRTLLLGGLCIPHLLSLHQQARDAILTYIYYL